MEREFVELGKPVRNAGALRRWLTAYAAASSTTASYETIRDAASAGESDKPAKTTTRPYRVALEQLWVIEPLPAWAPTRNRLRLDRLDAAVITTGPEAYRRADGIGVIPAGLLTA